VYTTWIYDSPDDNSINIKIIITDHSGGPGRAIGLVCVCVCVCVSISVSGPITFERDNL